MQEDHWTNVHANTKRFGFWKHEWEKHGTCAVDNPQLDTELKYFRKGGATLRNCLLQLLFLAATTHL